MIGWSAINFPPKAFLYLLEREGSWRGRGLCLTQCGGQGQSQPPCHGHPQLCLSICCCPNCEEGLGNIFSVLILYFPFPSSNIKHNFVLSLSLRLRFADVSTWKHDPLAFYRESFPALQLPFLHLGLQGFQSKCWHREMGPYQNPAIIPNPLLLWHKWQIYFWCVFGWWLVY